MRALIPSDEPSVDGQAPPSLPLEDSQAGVSGGVVAGVVGAAPALGPAVIGACASCAGVGTAAVAGTAGGAGLRIAGVALGLAVLAVVVAVRILRARRSCLLGSGRTRRALPGLASLIGSAALSFAVIQWIVVPVLSGFAGGSTPGQQLP